MSRTITLNEAMQRPFDQLLREIADTQESVCVVVSEGQTVEIKPKPTLKPLTRLPGNVAPGWKDAIYEPGR